MCKFVNYFVLPLTVLTVKGQTAVDLCLFLFLIGR